MKIPFNKPYHSDKAMDYIKKVIDSGNIGGDGYFTGKCKKLLETRLGVKNILLTTSCTHSLELAIKLINIEKDQEVIMPSYTFPSTANGVLVNGGKVVFTEVNHDDLCIDASKIEEKITQSTKAIIVVHYGGNPCDMDKIMDIAHKYGLYVIEDAAQGLLSTYKGRQLGTIGHFGCFSFHETKNVSAGEGGAVTINSNDENLIRRAEYIRQKGTNRIDFNNKNVEFYQWVDLGSSYCPSEILMAYLYSQLENIDDIHSKRLKIFNRYLEILDNIKSNKIQYYAKGNKSEPFNAHIFYIIFKKEAYADEFMDILKANDISAYRHFVPLHLSKMGLSLGYEENDFPYERDLYKKLIRLPIYPDMTEEQLNKMERIIVEAINQI
ncbi:dTDP-4-amino-4,6-dideoxygalactose transaminase [Vallitalea guaymasensis]|uniref:dTDP-4-amino-4,6-dideoxygalactose transaminase n=1 Tax=Vallitalea guaymasensis TaxID=1185412 RepID=UPI0023558143|nr:dTDP-4-amino-4,6-dideoxygalactose transaminase [Vallitalea guaymasensis]